VSILLCVCVYMQHLLNYPFFAEGLSSTHKKELFSVQQNGHIACYPSVHINFIIFFSSLRNYTKRKNILQSNSIIYDDSCHFYKQRSAFRLAEANKRVIMRKKANIRKRWNVIVFSLSLESVFFLQFSRHTRTGCR
jgi:hypothetical protein